MYISRILPQLQKTDVSCETTSPSKRSLCTVYLTENKNNSFILILNRFETVSFSYLEQRCRYNN